MFGRRSVRRANRRYEAATRQAPAIRPSGIGAQAPHGLTGASIHKHYRHWELVFTINIFCRLRRQFQHFKLQLTASTPITPYFSLQVIDTLLQIIDSNLLIKTLKLTTKVLSFLMWVSRLSATVFRLLLKVFRLSPTVFRLTSKVLRLLSGIFRLSIKVSRLFM